jgi:hypothetical protein
LRQNAKRLHRSGMLRNGFGLFVLLYVGARAPLW